MQIESQTKINSKILVRFDLSTSYMIIMLAKKELPDLKNHNSQNGSTAFLSSYVKCQQKQLFVSRQQLSIISL